MWIPLRNDSERYSRYAILLGVSLRWFDTNQPWSTSIWGWFCEAHDDALGKNRNYTHKNLIPKQLFEPEFRYSCRNIHISPDDVTITIWWKILWAILQSNNDDAIIPSPAFSLSSIFFLIHVKTNLLYSRVVVEQLALIKQKRFWGRTKVWWSTSFWIDIFSHLCVIVVWFWRTQEEYTRKHTLSS